MLGRFIRCFYRAKWKNLYTKIFTELDSSLTLLDVGAAGNMEERWFIGKPWINYYGVEPDKRSYDSMLEDKDVKSYSLLTKFAWSERTTKEFYLCSKPLVSSFYKPNFIHLEKFKNPSRFSVVDKLQADCERLEVELSGVDIDFAKFDIQGAELEAIRGLGEKIDSILGFEIEVEFQHLYIGQPLFDEIYRHLSAKGFVFIDFTKIIRWGLDGSQTRGQVQFANSLWMRDFSTIPVEKIPKYIFILLVYGKLSLCSYFAKALNNPRLDILLGRAVSRKSFIDSWFKLFNKAIQMFSGDFSTELHLIE